MFYKEKEISDYTMGDQEWLYHELSRREKMSKPINKIRVALKKWNNLKMSNYIYIIKMNITQNKIKIKSTDKINHIPFGKALHQ
jgi:hypothetical protein